MDASQLIAYLNAITVGELDTIRTKLGEARRACAELDHPELAAMIEEADAALTRADLTTFRKRIDTVVSRLGHVRV